jgi:putative NADPH-quinone reductase
LERAGHQVEIIDLYELHRQGFNPCLSEHEHRDYYEIGLDHPDPITRSHIESLAGTEMLVFVYPTWWSGLPAILKGWLDRTFLPEVAFTLAPPDSPIGGNGRNAAEAKQAVQPKLGNIRRIVGITTYGSGRPEVTLLGDGGRRTITRTVRLVCARRCRTTWLGLHSLDTRSAEERAAFLERVESKLAGLK